jgi:hypothetical protein
MCEYDAEPATILLLLSFHTEKQEAQSVTHLPFLFYFACIVRCIGLCQYYQGIKKKQEAQSYVTFTLFVFCCLCTSRFSGTPAHGHSQSQGSDPLASLYPAIPTYPPIGTNPATFTDGGMVMRGGKQ